MENLHEVVELLRRIARPEHSESCRCPFAPILECGCHSPAELAEQALRLLGEEVED
jgi:hypothetical protein